jgi:hypothetical protein
VTVTDTTEPTSILHAALAAHDAGLSVIPIRDDGTKKPALPWKQYQTERADRQQVRAWFAPGKHRAIGVVCGKVSGWLTMLEMEGWAFNADYWQAFKDAAETALGVARWAEIVRYVELSPTGGPHIYFRCPEHEVGNLKLARGLNDNGELVVMMETRGEGGYSVIAGSEGHPTGNPWRAVQGTIDDICDVTPGELEAIFQAARSLDQSPQVETSGVQALDSLAAGTGEIPHSPVPTPSDVGIRSDTAQQWMDQTIHEFNDSVGVLGILSWLPGWTYTATDNYQGEPVHRLHRDGSDNDHGALIFDSGRVAFFSSNCPTWADAYDGGTPKTYDAFTVMMLVDKGTNDSIARTAVARELRAQGFGPPLDTVTEPNKNGDSIPLDPDTGETDADTPDHAPSLRWVEEALADPPPEPELLVTGLLRRGEITVVGAPRAIGKTWASLNLATVCARGEGTMFGDEQFRVTQAARVLYLQGELGPWGSAARWKLLGGDMPSQMIAESFERIRIRTTERRVTTVEDGTTMSDTHIDAVVDWRLEQLIQQVQADVLVIDPWATFFAGNENSNDETEAAIIALTDIARRHNLAVWIVHHITNKGTRDSAAEPEDMWRGASRLADAVATRVTMLPYWTPARMRELGMDRRTARGQIRITVLERNGPPVDMVYSELRDHWWQDWTPPDIGRPPELTAKDVVRVLEANGGRVDSQRALEAKLEKGHTAVKRVVEHLVGAGVLQTYDGPRNSIGYELTGTGLPD